MAQTEDFSWQVHGTHIKGVCHTPATPVGVVVLIHGFGEHSGRYLPEVIPFLLHRSLAVIRFDLYGHGASGGKRGHCPGYSALLELISMAMGQAKTTYGELPVFLYGHSMGGNLVINQALRFPNGMKGIIASSPYLRLAFQPPGWKMAVGKLMLRVWPGLTLDAGLDPNGLSRVPAEVANYINDPLVHSRISPMYSFPVMQAGEWAIEFAGKLSVPALLLHGTADPIIDYRATEEFHQKSKLTSLRLFPGGFHELHNDLCRDGFFETMDKWLQSEI